MHIYIQNKIKISHVTCTGDWDFKMFLEFYDHNMKMKNLRLSLSTDYYPHVWPQSFPGFLWTNQQVNTFYPHQLNSPVIVCSGESLYRAVFSMEGIRWWWSFMWEVLTLSAVNLSRSSGSSCMVAILKRVSARWIPTQPATILWTF